jgi:16S rRNA (cytosine967-C5)-methyltransferase
VLPEENGDQIVWFLANHSEFAALPWQNAWREAGAGEPPPTLEASEVGLLLTPARHGTDGFFIAVLGRSS